MNYNAIINRKSQFGIINGVIMKNSEIYKIVIAALKNGNAKLLVDNEETLMYNIKRV